MRSGETLEFLSLSALAGWLVPEIFWWILGTLRRSAGHASAHLSRFIGLWLPPALVGLVVIFLVKNDPTLTDDLMKLIAVPAIMGVGLWLMYRAFRSKKKKKKS